MACTLKRPWPASLSTTSRFLSARWTEYVISSTTSVCDTHILRIALLITAESARSSFKTRGSRRYLGFCLRLGACDFRSAQLLRCWSSAVSTQRDVQHFYYRMTSADGRGCLVRRMSLRLFDSAGRLVTVGYLAISSSCFKTIEGIG